MHPADVPTFEIFFILTPIQVFINVSTGYPYRRMGTTEPDNVKKMGVTGAQANGTTLETEWYNHTLVYPNRLGTSGPGRVKTGVTSTELTPRYAIQSYTGLFKQLMGRRGHAQIHMTKDFKELFSCYWLHFLVLTFFY